ncbi:hypothetical protein EV384_5686 [Micromonospora kangleipakensis]|uniref:DUF1109 domain-containing protein n=1 Tax=Micromonospora kangleipakensis TaxID=1077942 RepID=A0A4Q8BG69_9ACTN|nr:hypothetical protein [Micromonospora kangleipakensis]RZU76974.1 hypothetical protein EV384_5686 [Micromonospora kangleipakensis]
MNPVAARRGVVWSAHGVGVGGAGCLSWAFSVPGFAVLIAMAAVAILGVAVVLWTVGAQLSHSAGRTWPWWLPLAPAMAVVMLVLLVTGVPLRARWALSRDAFEAVVAELPERSPATGFDPVPVPTTVGSYRITRAYLVSGGVVFYEENGAFFDDAGFAYLPDGPTPSLGNGSFESPVFRPLGGGWYRWTASW